MGCACGAKCAESAKDVHETAAGKVAEMVTNNPSKTTGAMAAELGVSEREVIRCLPETMAKEVAKEKFDEIVEEVSTWGALTVIVQNESTILEVKASFPKGTYGHGYYNLKPNGTPIGGHIRASELSAIFFISKPFMGRESHSIQFFDGNGRAMFKLYLGRDESKQIITDQKERFIALRERMR